MSSKLIGNNNSLIKNSNIFRHSICVNKKMRQELNGHKSFVLWFTGLSGSGKSSLAVATESQLHKMGIRTFVLDGDNIRHGLSNDLGFSPQERKENVRRVGETAKILVDAGILVLVSLISPYREDREMIREMFSNGDYHEVFVSCPLSICIRRDPKGLYKRALTGEIKGFTGIDDPYEIPGKPDLIIDTSTNDLQYSVDKIIAYTFEYLK